MPKKEAWSETEKSWSISFVASRSNSYIYGMQLQTTVLQATVRRIYQQKALRLLLHLCFWLFMLAVKNYMASITFNVYNGLPTTTLFKINLYGTALLAAFYYTLVYGLYPYAIRAKSILGSLLGLVVLFILYTVADGCIEAALLRNCTDCMALIEQNNPNYHKFL